tara:strand:+ start:568 stop:882 length:315 start_codon:yes stop_codon:yes gene_type:complete
MNINEYESKLNNLYNLLLCKVEDKKKNDLIEKKMEVLENKNNDLIEKVKQLENENNDLESENNDLKSKNNECEQELAKRKRVIMEYKRKLEFVEAAGGFNIDDL